MKKISERALKRAIARRPDVAARVRAEGLNLDAAVKAIARASAAPGAATAAPSMVIPPVRELGASAGLAMTFESIVLMVGRPSLLVTNGDFELPEDEEIAQRLSRARQVLRPAIAAVGRIEVFDGLRNFPAGSGWLVGDGIVITNRHVAELFVSSGEDGAPPTLMQDLRGRDYEVHVDFLEEHGLPGEREVRVTGVLYLAPRRGGVADVALLEIERVPGIPRPIPLFSGEPARDTWVGVIGYPHPGNESANVDQRADPRYRSAGEVH